MNKIDENAKTIKKWLKHLDFEHEHLGYGEDIYKKLDEIIYEETQKAAYEEQCEQEFIHQEQPNEDYFEGLNDYLDGTMSI